MNETMLQTAERVWPGEWGLVNFHNLGGFDELWRRLSVGEIASIMLTIQRNCGQYRTTFHVNADRRAFATHPDLETAIVAARDRVHALGRVLLGTDPATEQEQP